MFSQKIYNKIVSSNLSYILFIQLCADSFKFHIVFFLYLLTMYFKITNYSSLETLIVKIVSILHLSILYLIIFNNIQLTNTIIIYNYCGNGFVQSLLNLLKRKLSIFFPILWVLLKFSVFIFVNFPPIVQT